MKTNNSLMYPIILSMIGCLITIFFLRQVIFEQVFLWNVFPYVFTGVLSLRLQNKFYLCMGVLWMLMIDVPMIILTETNTKSGWILPLSLISTFKLFIAFPIGMLFGVMLNKLTHINK